MSLSAIPKGLRRRVFDRDGARCQYCRIAQIGQAALFHINHIVPKSMGGLTIESNLALQCPHCSLHKSNQMTATDRLVNEIFPLFHPVQQKWEEHFLLEVDGTCRGISGIGRVTVEALRMNDPLPRIARSLQISMGLLTP